MRDKRCSGCGYVSPTRSLDIRAWDCPNCKTHHARGSNAALNLLAVGLYRVSLSSDRKT
ncbi:transposase [Cyanobacteria bacterium FACHB-502]|nr:transposase [Cyanobacteria bacterium FACHB-502]